MSMNELERRCAFVLQNLDETWDNPSCGRSYEEIARAVLAEAGQAATIARVIGAAKSLLALCEQAGLADDLLATIYPDSKNRSGQTRDETAKQARRTMNEARAAIAEAAGAA